MPQNLIAIYSHKAESGPERYYYDTQISNNSGWGNGQVAFYAHSTQEPGTIPIYWHRTKHQDGDRYYYDDQSVGNTDWNDGVVAFYAYPANIRRGQKRQPGTVQIYAHPMLGSVSGRYIYNTVSTRALFWEKGAVAFWAYSADPAKWMALAPDNALLSQMSLPGTHESIAMHGYGSVCQDWTLKKQLASGLRVFDVRLRYRPGSNNTNFSVHHAGDYQYAFLASNFDHDDDAKQFVLDECLTFLKKNPKECIVLLIKQEKDQQHRATFFNAFWKIVESKGDPNDPEVLKKLFYAGNVVPKLEDVRGKIVFAFVDGDDGAAYQLTSPKRGLYWGNIDYQVDSTNVQTSQQPGLDVENHWQDSMSEKWGKVSNHLDTALKCGPSNTIWFTTYSSASHSPALGWFPRDYADYILPKLQEYVEGKLQGPQPLTGDTTYFGTVLMDFPNKDIIGYLIRVSIRYPYPS